jgi:CheY-like chemotaxis protein
MSSLPNVPPDAVSTPGDGTAPRVLLLAHPDLAEPAAAYLRRSGCEVIVPPFPEPTAEACAALLFPSKPAPAEPHEPCSRDEGVSVAFLEWRAFDAVVMQDLWLSATDRRMIPFGCTVITSDYYLHGNFNQPKVVLVTDPGFYTVMRQASRPCEEMLRRAFDRNAQISFVPVVGTERHAEALSRVAAAVKRCNGYHPPPAGRQKSRIARMPRDSDVPEQARAIALLSRSLAGYVISRARLVVIDDAPGAIRSVAAQFGRAIDPKSEASVHLCNISAASVASHSDYEELVGECERVLDSARESKELLLVVTDILFDAVDWDTERRTGIDLIDVLRTSQRRRRVKVGIIGLTGVVSPLVTTAAYRLGADAVVNKSPGYESALHHAHGVDELVSYKLLLTMASHCFQHEFLRAKRHAPAARARDERSALRRVLPSHAVSLYVQAEWQATEHLLDLQAADGDAASIRRIREQYD